MIFYLDIPINEKNVRIGDYTHVFLCLNIILAKQIPWVIYFFYH